MKQAEGGRELTSKQLSVQELEIGMYVHRLDRSWLGTPYPLQGFYIQSEEDILQLANFCKHVFIDQYRQRDSSSIKHQHKQPELKRQVDTQTKLATSEINFVQAKQIWRESRQLSYKIVDRIQHSYDIDRDQVEQAANSLSKAVIKRPNTMLWLARIKEHDNYTAEHCLSVGILAASFGHFLGVRPQDLDSLSLAGMLHDVGKIRIQPELLNKTTPLTDQEFSKLKAHAKIGYQLLLKDQSMPSLVLDAALNHHERMDGKGYPNGLAGEQISRIARIIAIVDAYDAMTSERPYADAKTHIAALREIRLHAGAQFDTALAKAFIRMMGLYPPGSLVKLSDGSLAVVIQPKEKDPHRPIVARAREADGLPCEIKLIDLSVETSLRIRLEVKENETTLDLRRFTDEHLGQLMNQLNHNN